MKMIENIVNHMVDAYCSESPHPDYWDIDGLILYMEGILLPKGAIKIEREEFDYLDKETLKERIIERAKEEYEKREAELGSELMRELERVVLLRVVDEKWMDHIDAMDQLRQGIGLRAYGQRDPVIEYKFEGHEMFEAMIRAIQEDSAKIVLKSRIDPAHAPKREKVAEPVSATHSDEPPKPMTKGRKVGRNDPCPCGSGKKYKKCCGAE